MYQWLKRCQHYLLNTLKSNFASKALIGIFIQSIAILIGFLLNIIIARLVNPQEFGNYVYLLSWVTLLAGIFTIGLDDLLLQNIPKYKINNQPELIKGLIIFSHKLVAYVISISLFLFLILLLFVNNFPFILNNSSVYKNYVQFFLNANNYYWIQFGLILVIIQAFIIVQQAVLQSNKNLIAALLPDKIIKPILFITIIAILHWNAIHLSAKQIIIINTILTFVALLMFSALMFSYFKKKWQTNKTSFETKLWNKNLTSLFLITLINLVYIKIDVIILGTISGTTQSGIYSIASKFAEILRLLLVMLNWVVSPKIAELYATNNINQLKHITRFFARYAALIAVICFIIFIIAGKFLLALYGEVFKTGYTTLLILSFSQLINISCGIGATILIMTNNAKLLPLGLIISLITLLIFLFWLIPIYNIEGAAYASLISILVWNGYLIYFTKKKLGFSPTIF